jgi:hypothetical protein
MFSLPALHLRPFVAKSRISPGTLKNNVADREQGRTNQRTRHFRPKRKLKPTNARPTRAIVTGSGVGAAAGLCCPACITVAPTTSADGAKVSNHNFRIISIRFIFRLLSKVTASSLRLP